GNRTDRCGMRNREGVTVTRIVVLSRSGRTCRRSFVVIGRVGGRDVDGVFGSVYLLRGDRDSTQLARIQPVQLTPFAGMDHDVPGAAVEMTEHGLRADRTVDRTVTGILTTRQRHAKGAFFVDARRVDDRGETVHRDQHAEAARAAEERMTLESTV